MIRSEVNEDGGRSFLYMDYPDQIPSDWQYVSYSPMDLEQKQVTIESLFFPPKIRKIHPNFAAFLKAKLEESA